MSRLLFLATELRPSLVVPVRVETRSGKCYSITSVIRASNDVGTVRSRVLEVLRLMANSYSVGATALAAVRAAQQPNVLNGRREIRDIETQIVSRRTARDDHPGADAYRNAHRRRGDVPRPTRHRGRGARTTMYRLRGQWYRRRPTRCPASRQP
jgi:hypothetical protein